MVQRKSQREVQRLLPPVDTKWRTLMMPNMLNLVGQTYVLSQPPRFFFPQSEQQRCEDKLPRGITLCCIPLGGGLGVGGGGSNRVDTQSCGFSDSLIDLLYLSSWTRLPVRIKEFVLSNLHPERGRGQSRITQSRNIWKTGAHQPRVSGWEV